METQDKKTGESYTDAIHFTLPKQETTEEEPQEPDPPQKEEAEEENKTSKNQDNYEDEYYDMSGKKLMTIFNFETFQDTVDYNFQAPSKRSGTAKDVSRLAQIFGIELGFEVNKHQDLSFKSCWKKLKQLRKRDYSSYSCFSIVILTHGGKNGKLCAADRQFNLDDVLKLFIDFLPGVPKLYIVQACRGGLVDEGTRMSFTDGGKTISYKLPSHSDTLVLRSTIEGFVSWRDDTGSWLIQELCNAVQEHYKKDDLLRILTKVNLKIAKYYASNNNDYDTHNKKQMPEITFTLTKMLRFNNSITSDDLLWMYFKPAGSSWWPKMACRGGLVDEGTRMSFTDGGKTISYKLPSHSDTLVLRSTIEGFVSWRDDTGSWLIQELCNAVQEHYKKDDLLRILTKVNLKIAKYWHSNTNDYDTHNKKQMPEITFTLTKMLRFNNSITSDDLLWMYFKPAGSSWWPKMVCSCHGIEQRGWKGLLN